MGYPRKASAEMISDVVLATNRHTHEREPRMGAADVLWSFPEDEHESILGEVEELLELLPTSEDGMLEVKWGHDDERSFPPLPDPDLPIHERFEKGGWRIYRTDAAVYVFPVPDTGAGPVIFWFSHEDNHQTFDTGEPQPHGYVDQD